MGYSLLEIWPEWCVTGHGNQAMAPRPPPTVTSIKRRSGRFEWFPRVDSTSSRFCRAKKIWVSVVSRKLGVALQAMQMPLSSG